MTETTIILAAGGRSTNALPFSPNLSNAMAPVLGKPVIGWILDDLIAKGITQATVVLRADDNQQLSFLTRAYMSRLVLYIAEVSETGSILDSLRAGMDRSPVGDTVRVILGDTLIRDSFHNDRSFVYYSIARDSTRWCVVDVDEDGMVSDYHDKQDRPGDYHMALAGYYHFSSGSRLKMALHKALNNGTRELSGLLRHYGEHEPIQAVEVSEWFDFGNPDHFAEARRKLIMPRHFNSLSFNPVLNTIVKRSKNGEKLHDEENWFRQLPRDLQILAPRVIDSGEQDGIRWFMQEYYGYPTLAEHYVYLDLGQGIWASILRTIFRVHVEFEKYTVDPVSEHMVDMYFHKTRQRLESLREQHPDWTLLQADQISYNGTELVNAHLLLDKIEARAHAVAETGTFTVIHGDFCFSNILFDVMSQIVRLIDPRGSFGDKGIYGDPRYDIAKLRHSVVGLYDFVVADLFELIGEDDEYYGTLLADSEKQRVGEIFDTLIAENGYDLDEIKFIEALLFLSMTPLHADFPSRQKMMYLHGLAKLNEVL